MYRLPRFSTSPPLRSTSTHLLRLHRPEALSSTSILYSVQLATSRVKDVRQSRSIHTTRPLRASALFQLSNLSNSRETQWFSKASGLSPVAHSTSLELIRISEVLPFYPQLKRSQHVPKGKSRHGRDARSTAARRNAQNVNTTDGASATAAKARVPYAHAYPTTHDLATPSTTTKPAFTSVSAITQHTTPAPFVQPILRLPPRDLKALTIGRTLLHLQQIRLRRLRTLLASSQRHATKAQSRLEAENKRLRHEIKGASVAVLAAVGVATGMVAWWGWPKEGVIRSPRMAMRVSGDASVETRTGGLPSARSLEPGYLGGASTFLQLGKTSGMKEIGGTAESARDVTLSQLPTGWEHLYASDARPYYAENNDPRTTWQDRSSGFAAGLATPLAAAEILQDEQASPKFRPVNDLEIVRGSESRHSSRGWRGWFWSG